MPSSSVEDLFRCLRRFTFFLILYMMVCVVDIVFSVVFYVSDVVVSGFCV